jgi:hypothetical protein
MRRQKLWKSDRMHQLHGSDAELGKESVEAGYGRQNCALPRSRHPCDMRISHKTSRCTIDFCGATF